MAALGGFEEALTRSTQPVREPQTGIAEPPDTTRDDLVLTNMAPRYSAAARCQALIVFLLTLGGYCVVSWAGFSLRHQSP